MKTFLLLSWRNIWRQKKRSLVVISSIGIGVIGMVLSMGILNSMTTQMIDNTISTSIGHISIQKKGFQDTMKIRYRFTPEKDVMEVLKAQKNIAWAPRVKVQGMARSSEASRGVLVVGIDPEKEKNVSKIYEYTVGKHSTKQSGKTGPGVKDRGEFLDSMDSNEILISKLMAERLDLYVGDRMVIMMEDKNKQIVGEGFVVRGLFETPIDTFDRYVVFTGIKRLQEFSGIGNSISEITVLSSNKEKVDGLKKSLNEKITMEGIDVLSWKDMAPDLVSAVALFDQLMIIFFLVVFITVIFSVANTMVMAIMERFHEIGVMKSVGTKPSWIFLMVVLEAVNLGIVGIAAGIGISVSLVTWFSLYGLDLSTYMEGMRSLGSGSVLYPYLGGGDIAAAILIVFFTTIIAALYPAVKAARIKPLEALNYI